LYLNAQKSSTRTRNEVGKAGKEKVTLNQGEKWKKSKTKKTSRKKRIYDVMTRGGWIRKKGKGL